MQWVMFLHRFHRISYINLQQKLVWWNVVRNALIFAVIFLKEIRWNAVKYLLSSHLPQPPKIYPQTLTRDAAKATKFKRGVMNLLGNTFHRNHHNPDLWLNEKTEKFKGGYRHKIHGRIHT